VMGHTWKILGKSMGVPNKYIGIIWKYGSAKCIFEMLLHLLRIL